MRIFATIDKLEKIISSESISSLKQQIHKIAEIVKISQKEPDISSSKRLLEKLPEPSNDLILGGHQTIFGIRTTIPEIGDIVLKTYKMNLADIILHYCSTRSFNSTFKDNIFAIGQNQVIINIVDVLTVGFIQINEFKTPFLVQKYSRGIPITNEVLSTLVMTQTDFINVFRNLVKHGIVLDPFLKNWRIIPSSELEGIIIEYIDLIYWNFSQIKTHSKEVLASLSLI
ncbi:MAG: hypothetical protein ACW964_06975 [Candidatus Hodarchaeales archaeon]|jgi:hypothetical protein